MSKIKVGDVVAWKDVPDGALVRCLCGDQVAYALRRNGRGCWLSWWRPTLWHHWCTGPSSTKCVTIVALGLTGEESAADLQRLAEVFEVREYLIRSGDDAVWCGQELDVFAACLRAAGWRPGMSAEDAARLLAGVP